VFLWDVATARTLRRWSGHFGRVNCVGFGGDWDSVVLSGEPPAGDGFEVAHELGAGVSMLTLGGVNWQEALTLRFGCGTAKASRRSRSRCSTRAGTVSAVCM